ncbi:Peptidase family M23 [compost metagenome]
MLAHLREGSVSVSEGQLVSTQTRLGEVGNSGNTSEPHLHIHAKRGARGDILDGEAVPFTIDGRYLVRGDVLESR